MKKRQIPNKLYFRIGEVSEIVGVKAYVLRYWETEFPDIRPTKSKSGQRLYKRRDVELLLQVRDLLYEERYTIDGAKQRLRELMRLPKEQPVAPAQAGKVTSAHTTDGHELPDDCDDDTQDTLFDDPAPPSTPTRTHAPYQSAMSHVPVRSGAAQKNGGSTRASEQVVIAGRTLDGVHGKKLLLKLRTDLVNMLGELKE